jgi:hypothetical protein
MPEGVRGGPAFSSALFSQLTDQLLDTACGQGLVVGASPGPTPGNEETVGAGGWALTIRVAAQPAVEPRLERHHAIPALLH